MYLLVVARTLNVKDIGIIYACAQHVQCPVEFCFKSIKLKRFFSACSEALTGLNCFKTRLKIRFLLHRCQ